MAETSLMKSAVSGMRWLLLKSFLSEGVTIATTVAVARLISPAEFGRAAIALLFVMLATMLTFEGFASALVQRESVSEAHRESRRNSWRAGRLSPGSIGLPVRTIRLRADLGPETGGLVCLAAPSFVIGGFGCVSWATLWRELAFRRMTQIDLAAGLIASVATVVLAALGLEAKALVIGGLVSIGVTSVLQMILLMSRCRAGIAGKLERSPTSVFRPPLQGWLRPSLGISTTGSLRLACPHSRPGSTTERSTWGWSTSQRSATSWSLCLSLCIREWRNARKCDDSMSGQRVYTRW